MKNLMVCGGFEKQREIVEEAVVWYTKKFLPRVRKLEINIRLKNLGPDYHGFCSRFDDREFFIELNSKCSVFELVATAIHEMIHVKQYVKYEMMDLHTGSVRWKTRPINPDNLDYWDHPWEKEAHRNDEKLAKEFLAESGRVL